MNLRVSDSSFFGQIALAVEFRVRRSVGGWMLVYVVGWISDVACGLDGYGCRSSHGIGLGMNGREWKVGMENSAWAAVCYTIR